MRLFGTAAAGAALAFLLAFSGCGGGAGTIASKKDADFVFGMLLVGPANDRGWSQATFEGGKYVESRLPGSRMVYIDRVNPNDRLGTTASQLAESMLAQGAKTVIFNSDDMRDEAHGFARRHPEIPVIHISGDGAWKEGKGFQGLPNLVNLMGRFEYAKMMGGFVAALTTRSGKVAYLGPLVNDETRRLAVAAYLGARYAWTHALGKSPSDLRFKVVWIGFWFNIPGVTADPSRMADDLFQSGYDVIISGLDSTEALTEAARFNTPERMARTVLYEYKEAGKAAPECSLGVMYFNWGPAFFRNVKEARDGGWKPGFFWEGRPDLSSMNDADRDSVGFFKGAGLEPSAAAKLDAFISELGSGLNLWEGPLRFQDGTPFLDDGVVADDIQVWYLPQLLEGMEGQSVLKK